jgi:hypothetical protein
MDKIFSPIKARAMMYVNYKRISKECFFEQTNISASNFKGKGAESELGGDKIAKILTAYPDLSSEWLITGQGEMLKSISINQKGEHYVHAWRKYNGKFGNDYQITSYAGMNREELIGMMEDRFHYVERQAAQMDALIGENKKLIHEVAKLTDQAVRQSDRINFLTDKLINKQ